MQTNSPSKKSSSCVAVVAIVALKVSPVATPCADTVAVAVYPSSSVPAATRLLIDSV